MIVLKTFFFFLCIYRLSLLEQRAKKKTTASNNRKLLSFWTLRSYDYNFQLRLQKKFLVNAYTFSTSLMVNADQSIKFAAIIKKLYSIFLWLLRDRYSNKCSTHLQPFFLFYLT